jgi:phage protein U
MEKEASPKKNQPWGQLGGVQFRLLTAPKSFSTGYDYNYVEQPRILGKPTLQQVGGTLRTIDLEFEFHYSFCEPQKQLAQFTKMAGKQQAVPLTLGDRYEGDWVIESIPVTINMTDAQAQLLSINVQVKLKEWVGEKQKKSIKQKKGFTKKTVR